MIVIAMNVLIMIFFMSGVWSKECS